MDTSEKLNQLAAALHDIASEMSATATRLVALVQVLDERGIVPSDAVRERAAVLYKTAQTQTDMALRTARARRRLEQGPPFKRPLHGEPPAEEPEEPTRDE